MFRLFNLFRRDIVADLLNGRITVENFYRQLYTYVVLVTTAIFTLSIVADVAGFNGLNIVLIPVWVIVMGYVGFHPTYITLALTTGAVSTIGRDMDRQRLINGINAASGVWKQFFLHIAMFGGVFFLTRFLVPIRAYPFAGMLMLGALITLGLWNWLYTEKAVYYRRYVLAIVLLAITIGLFGAFTGDRPAAGENPMAPMHNGMKEAVRSFFHKERHEVQVSSLSEEVEVSGIKPGTRKFSVPDRQFVLLLGTNTSSEINDKIRVNEKRAGENFEVAADGKVKVKFVGPPEFLRQQIDWQSLTIEVS
jgi:hypothetical protein